MSEDSIQKLTEAPQLQFTSCEWFIRQTESKSHKRNKTCPCRRWGHSSVIQGNQMFIYGGTGKKTNSKNWDSVYKLDLDRWQWLKLESNNLAPSLRDSHSCTILDNKLYVFGGSDGNDPQNDLYEYDLENNTWRKLDVKGAIPKPREGHSTCLLDNRHMVVYGGWDGEETFADSFVFDIQNKIWRAVEKKSGPEPSPRESQSCCMVRDYIYLFGGQGVNIVKNGVTLENFFNDMHRFKISFEDNKVWATWEKIETKGPRPAKRSSHSTCTYKDRYMFIAGGEGYPPDFNEESELGDNFKTLNKSNEMQGDLECYPKSDVWYFDVEINEWYKLSIKNENEFIPRFAHSCNIYNDYLVVFGGLKDYNNLTNDLSVLSLVGQDPFHQSGQHIHLDPTNVPKKLPLDQRSVNNLVVCSICKTKFSRKKEATSSAQKEKLTDGIGEDNHEQKNVILPKNPRITGNFITLLSSSITWPFAAFGLFIDNALMNGAKSMKINHLVKPRARSKIKELNDENFHLIKEYQDDNSREINYLMIEDDGEGWSPEEFHNIMTTYDKNEDGSPFMPGGVFNEKKEEEIKSANTVSSYGNEKNKETSNSNSSNDKMEEEKGRESKSSMRKDSIHYALNLKLSSFRLGKTMVFSSIKDDCVSLGLAMNCTKSHQNSNKPSLYFVSWNTTTNQYKTYNGEKTRNFILSFLNIFSEDELTNFDDETKNRLIIIDLTSAKASLASGSKEEHELILRKKRNDAPSDIVLKSFDKSMKNVYQPLSSMNVVDYSLRTYLKYFFLESSKPTLDITLNESKINFAFLKDGILNRVKQEAMISLTEESLFEGFVVRNLPVPESKERASRNVKMKFSKTLEKEDNYEENLQGILIYSENRLIKRFENAQLGSIDYLINSLKYNTKLDTLQHPNFDLNGFICLEKKLKPNITATDIDNPYHSSYVYSTILSKLKNSEYKAAKGASNSNTKRKSPVEPNEILDNSGKKIKV